MYHRILFRLRSFAIRARFRSHEKRNRCANLSVAFGSDTRGRLYTNRRINFVRFGVWRGCLFLFSGRHNVYNNLFYSVCLCEPRTRRASEKLHVTLASRRFLCRNHRAGSRRRYRRPGGIYTAWERNSSSLPESPSFLPLCRLTRPIWITVAVS